MKMALKNGSKLSDLYLGQDLGPVIRLIGGDSDVYLSRVFVDIRSLALL